MTHPRASRIVGSTRTPRPADPAWGPMLDCTECGELFYFGLSPDGERCEWCVDRTVAYGGFGRTA